MSSIFYKEPNDVKKASQLLLVKNFKLQRIVFLLYSIVKEATSKYRNIDLIYINFG